MTAPHGGATRGDITGIIMEKVRPERVSRRPSDGILMKGVGDAADAILALFPAAKLDAGPYSYEHIPAGSEPANYRMRDSADNRIATCYVEGNALAIVDGLNRVAKLKLDHESDLASMADCVNTALRECERGGAQISTWTPAAIKGAIDELVFRNTAIRRERDALRADVAKLEAENAGLRARVSLSVALPEDEYFLEVIADRIQEQLCDSAELYENKHRGKAQAIASALVECGAVLHQAEVDFDKAEVQRLGTELHRQGEEIVSRLADLAALREENTAQTALIEESAVKLGDGFWGRACGRLLKKVETLRAQLVAAIAAGRAQTDIADTLQGQFDRAIAQRDEAETKLADTERELRELRGRV